MSSSGSDLLSDDGLTAYDEHRGFKNIVKVDEFLGRDGVVKD